MTLYSSFHQPTLSAIGDSITNSSIVPNFINHIILSVSVEKSSSTYQNAKTRSSSYFFQVQAAQLYSFPTCTVLHPLQVRKGERKFCLKTRSYRMCRNSQRKTH